MREQKKKKRPETFTEGVFGDLMEEVVDRLPLEALATDSDAVTSTTEAAAQAAPVAVEGGCDILESVAECVGEAAEAVADVVGEIFSGI